MITQVRDTTRLETATLAQYVCATLGELGVCGRIIDCEPYSVEVTAYDYAPLGSIQILDDGTRVYDLLGVAFDKVEKALLDVLYEDGQL